MDQRPEPPGEDSLSLLFYSDGGNVVTAANDEFARCPSCRQSPRFLVFHTSSTRFHTPPRPRPPSTTATLTAFDVVRALRALPMDSLRSGAICNHHAAKRPGGRSRPPPTWATLTTTLTLAAVSQRPSAASNALARWLEPEIHPLASSVACRATFSPPCSLSGTPASSTRVAVDF